MDADKLAQLDLLVDDAIKEAERRMRNEKESATKRRVQLAREQGYHRLALAIDRPERSKKGAPGPGQLCLFPTRDPSLFDE